LFGRTIPLSVDRSEYLSFVACSFPLLLTWNRIWRSNDEAQMASEIWLCMFIPRIFQRLQYTVSRDPLKQNQGTLKEYINCWAWKKCIVRCWAIFWWKSADWRWITWTYHSVGRNRADVFSLLHYHHWYGSYWTDSYKRFFLHVEISLMWKTTIFDAFQVRVWLIIPFPLQRMKMGSFTLRFDWSVWQTGVLT